MTTMPDPQAKQPILTEGKAKLVGVLVTLVSIGLVKLFFGMLGDVVGLSFLLLGLLYLSGAPFFYKLTRSWEDGLSKAEAKMLLTYPLSVFKVAKETGFNTSDFNSTLTDGIGGLHIDAADDDSGYLIPEEKDAKTFGLILWAIGLVTLVGAFFTALSIAWNLLWLAGIVWAIGVVFAFWTSKRYRNGMFGSDFTAISLWFYERPKVLFNNWNAGRKARKSRS